MIESLELLYTLNSLISMQQILFFLRKNSHLHALLEPTRLFIFRENSYLHAFVVYLYFGKIPKLSEPPCLFILGEISN